jgi:hypothetical protein
MPIGQTGTKRVATKLLVPLDPDQPVILRGTAVSALVQDGNLICQTCSAANNPEQFYGFVEFDTISGNLARIITERGAVLTPLVEGDLPLMPGQSVFLSNTDGRVTQINVPDLQYIYPVGFAVNESEMTLITDYKVDIPK